MLYLDVQYSELPEEVTREELPDGTERLVMRNHVTELEIEEGTAYTADEAVMVAEQGDTLDDEDIAEDYQGCFEYVANWQPPQTPTLEELAAKVDYLMIKEGL